MKPARARIPVTVALQDAVGGDRLPDSTAWMRWVGAACERGGETGGGSVTIRLVGRDESDRLNSTWRSKSGPTNVLAFVGPAADTPLPAEERELGDLVVCVPVVFDEALAQGKAPEAHMAHMAVHGTLHLLGFDHDTIPASETMEALETDIMRDLGFEDPYSEE